MHCKRYLLASVSALAMLGVAGLAAPARAADLPARTPYMKAPPLAPAFSWTGFYLGVQGGYGWLDHKQTIVSDSLSLEICSEAGLVDSCSLGKGGGVVGGFAGYNWQSGNIVFGLEADGSWTGLKRTETFTSNRIGPPIAVTGNVEWLATIRGRLGAAFGRTLVYATGGVAFGGVNSGWTTTIAPAVAFTLDKGTKTGWVAGGGIEHAFAGNWSVRAEVLYHDLGKDTGSVTYAGGTYSTTFRHAVTAARAGLALRW
jgi:outer membrane immunogenic protein